MNKDSITTTHFKPTLAGARAQAAGILLAQNNSLSGTGDYRTNEKTVNSIYLSTVAVGNYTFTPTQLASLQAIASQCPLTGGEAVMRARDLLALAPNPPVFYNDASICGSVLRPALEERTDNNPGGDFVEVRPNPASEYLEIHYGFSAEKQGRQLVLFDVFGKVASSIPIPDRSGTKTVQVSHLSAGIYRYSIIGSVLTGNVVITH